MVHVSSESKYLQLLAAFLAKKKRLAADGWGPDAKHVSAVFEPIELWAAEVVSDYCISSS
jgi:hypothetical protein